MYFGGVMCMIVACDGREGVLPERQKIERLENGTHENASAESTAQKI